MCFAKLFSFKMWLAKPFSGFIIATTYLANTLQTVLRNYSRSKGSRTCATATTGRWRCLQIIRCHPHSLKKSLFVTSYIYKINGASAHQSLQSLYTVHCLCDKWSALRHGYMLTVFGDSPTVRWNRGNVICHWKSTGIMYVYWLVQISTLQTES